MEIKITGQHIKDGYESIRSMLGRDGYTRTYRHKNPVALAAADAYGAAGAYVFLDSCLNFHLAGLPGKLKICVDGVGVIKLSEESNKDFLRFLRYFDSWAQAERRRPRPQRVKPITLNVDGLGKVEHGQSP